MYKIFILVNICVYSRVGNNITQITYFRKPYSQLAIVLFDVVKNRKLSCVNTHFQYLFCWKDITSSRSIRQRFIFFLIAFTSMLGFEQYIDWQYSQRIWHTSKQRPNFLNYIAKDFQIRPSSLFLKALFQKRFWNSNVLNFLKGAPNPVTIKKHYCSSGSVICLGFLIPHSIF